MKKIIAIIAALGMVSAFATTTVAPITPAKSAASAPKTKMAPKKTNAVATPVKSKSVTPAATPALAVPAKPPAKTGVSAS